MPPPADDEPDDDTSDEGSHPSDPDAARPPRAPSSLAAHLAKKFGKGLDPNISLDQPPPQAESAKVKKSLPRLSGRSAVTSRYTLRGEIARGGMGMILKVWDEDLRRTLAMKVVLGRGETSSSGTAGSASDPQVLRRFLEEAQITGQLDHPGVVPVHELGIDAQDRVFFTMRLVKGRDLAEIFRLARAGKESWNPTRAVAVILRVAEAMAYAHSKRVIHRDLKPENVMVGKYGETYVMDWGLAKVLGRDESAELRSPTPQTTASLIDVKSDWLQDDGGEHDPDEPLRTQDGTIVGTPAFMPPEQAVGPNDERGGELGPWSDVYSLGAIMYTLLTGQLPYVPPNRRVAPQRIVMDLLTGPPVPVQEIDRKAPPELVAICEKAMARQIRKRYPDMMAMADDLRAYLEGRVVGAYGGGRMERFRKLVRRNRPVAAAIVAIGVTVLGAIVAFGLLQQQKLRELRDEQGRTRDARDAAQKSATLAIESADQARKSEKAALARSYVANLVAADASLRANEVVDAKRRLEACEPALRGFEWRHLRLRSDTSRRVLGGHTARVTSVAWSADGAFVVSGSEDKTIRVTNPETGETIRTIADAAEGIAALALSPDGSRIVASLRQDTALWMWNARSGEMMRTLSGHEGSVSALAFSPDGSRLASGASDGAVRLWDAATGAGAGEKTLDAGGQGVLALAFDPNGARLAAGLADGRVLVFRLSPGEGPPLEIAGENGASVQAVAFSPDGSLLATGAFDAGVRLFDAATGERRATLEGHTDPVYSVAFAPGGTLVVSASLDRTLREWTLGADGTWKPLATLRGHDGPVWSVACAPDGRRVVSASSDGTLRVWDLKRGEASRVLAGKDDFVSAVAFDKTGARVVLGSHFRGRVQVFDAATGAETLAIEGATDAVNAVAFDPSGTRIAAGIEEGANVLVYDAASGKTLATLAGHEASVTSVAFFPDGERVVSGSGDNTARVFDVATREVKLTLKGHENRVTAVAVSADGARVATASFDKTARLWDGRTGAPERVLTGHAGSVLAVAFDPAGGRVVTGGDDETARIFDVATGAENLVLRGHFGAVNAVAFSPDGTRVATGGFDKTVRVFDAESGEMLLALRGHEGWVTSVAFSPDGSRILSGSFDNSARLWETEPAAAGGSR